ncbi:BC1872 family protein [Paenibacillus sp. Leaf72]|uniref:BC1872 family protein n=1 Tax=Paenibacillus sp. Leaf72 TaxID=1736234 RepID=UPI000701B1F8|nr:hypothetical protein [Paenibacillus sp. Leaf72]KQN96901.1 hypothetical protein ASF12_22800 [Paenibacillus sp. Leaf72]
MIPGKELDAKVAELVLRMLEVHWSHELPKYKDNQGAYHVVKGYSTDESVVWDVVEALEHEVTIKRFKGMTGWSYWCRVSNPDPTKFDEVIARGETAPEAICKAALLSVLGYIGYWEK